jgi:radical SAM superfamily enzyme YgiQ (UPF0313 family)
MMMSKVLLSLPPNYCFSYDFFPLGTPMLAGYLRSHGIEAEQIDLNLGYLAHLKKKIFAPEGDGGIPFDESHFVVMKLLNDLFGEKARKDYYFSPFLADDFYMPYNDKTNSSFCFTERLLSSQHLFRYLDDGVENTFLAYYLEEDILSDIASRRPDVLALSIIAPSQAIAALTLGRLVKEHLPDIHVVIGGQWVSLFRDELFVRPELSRCFDSLIYFEGETPLYMLTQALKEKAGLGAVPNLIYWSDGRFVKSSRTSREDMDELACPDFDGIPLGDYTRTRSTGQVSLTYQTARECYWNRCAYCVDLPLPKQGYRERSIDLVIADVKRLIDRYGMSYLEISNATISPHQLKAFSEHIIQEKLKFGWKSMARMDAGFTKDILEKARSAGCDLLVFGLESATQRVLDFVEKGINVKTAERIISDCHEAGISVGLQMMLGMPSETTAEAIDTIAFLVENRAKINLVGFNTYYVTPGCEVYRDPARFGIDRRRYVELPFKFFHEYSHLTGELSQKRAARFWKLYCSLIDAKAGKQEGAFAKENAMPGPETAFSLTVGRETASIRHTRWPGGSAAR